MQCLKALGYISFWLQLPETVLIFLQVRRENSEKWFKVPHSPLPGADLGGGGGRPTLGKLSTPIPNPTLD